MLGCEYLLEHVVRHPDYHRVEPLPTLVLNGHIDQCEPAIFNATQISALGAPRPQTSRNRDTAYGTRWFVRVDILLLTIRRLEDENVTVWGKCFFRLHLRSEERRVGKECRVAWCADR